MVYLRLLTSAQIQDDPEEFGGFIEDPVGYHEDKYEEQNHEEQNEEIRKAMLTKKIKDFCTKFVEPLGIEAGQFSPFQMDSGHVYTTYTVDHIQIAALTRALETKVKIASLRDKVIGGEVDFAENGSDFSGDPLHLLHR